MISHEFSLITLQNIPFLAMKEPRQRSILLVEDESSNVILIRRAMSKLGQSIHLQAVEDGEAAVRYLQATHNPADPNGVLLPDVVLTDLKMPRMNGLELLAWIKQHPQFGNLPVVMLSSSEDAEDIRRANELGASSYFVRPGSLKELIEILQKIVTVYTENSP